jgi:hypothetical protein
MKRLVYYLSFILLSTLVAFFLHAIIETAYIELLLQDYNKYGLGLTWNTWETIHDVSVISLLLLFGYLGYRGGKKWWSILYVEKKYKRWGKSLKENF